MNKIIVASDSFKGSLTSWQTVEIIAETLGKQLPDVEIIQCPLADGGEGTAEILSPYMPDNVCLIESAELIGLNLPQMQSLDVGYRGSHPLGGAILAGLDAGKRKFVIGLGGSATNDCGLGMLMTLGMKALDVRRIEVEANLSGLLKVNSIDLSGLDPRLAESRLTVLSDVTSPLCGKNGSTSVYGPQKGVCKEDISRIDAAMLCFGELYGKPELINAPGAGAAGGLGFALMMLGGKIVSGASYVMERTGFHEQLGEADWVITGEGCSDAQTLHGKLPIKVAQAAREAGAKVALISGSVDRDILPELEKRFDLVISAKPNGMDVYQAIEQAEKLLADSAALFSTL